MNLKFRPIEEGNTYIPLSHLKEEMRVTTDREDEKIKRIINQAFEFFENNTGFLLRTGELELMFNIQDRIDYDNRSIRTYADYWDRGVLGHYEENNYIYHTSCSAEVETQRPISLEFYSREDRIKQILTQEEIDTLPENFFFVQNTKTLAFMLSYKASIQSEVPEVLREKSYSDNTTLPITLKVKTKDVFEDKKLPQDIYACILRVASRLYEFPFDNTMIHRDYSIMGVLEKYNSKADI